MNTKKINILEYEWLDKNYHNLVLSEFEEAHIPTFKAQTLSLLELNNNSYWGGLRSVHRIDLAVLDHRHWCYDDIIFAKYVERIVSVKFPVVCLFTSPMGYEMPRVNPNAFSDKLFKRTEILANAVRRRHKDTLLLSPGIDVTDENLIELYLDYFINNRQHFDAYAVHCCNYSDEHSLGRLTHLLTQVMKVLPKEIWVTKWAIPTFQGKIVDSRFLGEHVWKPYNYAMATQRLRRVFNLIETTASHGSRWFYTGVGSDAYNPRLTPSTNEYWKPLTLDYIPKEYTSRWDFWHFLGMVDYDNKVKEPFLKALLHLAASHNNNA